MNFQSDQWSQEQQLHVEAVIRCLPKIKLTHTQTVWNCDSLKCHTSGNPLSVFLCKQSLCTEQRTGVIINYRRRRSSFSYAQDLFVFSLKTQCERWTMCSTRVRGQTWTWPPSPNKDFFKTVTHKDSLSWLKIVSRLLLCLIVRLDEANWKHRIKKK